MNNNMNNNWNPHLLFFYQNTYSDDLDDSIYPPAGAPPQNNNITPTVITLLDNTPPAGALPSNNQNSNTSNVEPRKFNRLTTLKPVTLIPRKIKPSQNSFDRDINVYFPKNKKTNPFDDSSSEDIETTNRYKSYNPFDDNSEDIETNQNNQ